MKILLVDDEQESREVVAESLDLFHKIGSFACSNQKEAEEAWNKHKDKIDIAVLDYLSSANEKGNKTSRTGSALARKLRAEKPNMPIIIITGTPKLWTDENPDLADIPVLKKPFNVDELKKLIDESMKSPKRHDLGQVFSAGQLKP